jgi:hypothetical protein
MQSPVFSITPIQPLIDYYGTLSPTRIHLAGYAPAFATSNSITTLEQVNYLLTSCPLLRAFYDETLRLHSSSSSNRIVVEDTIVGGCTLKVGHNIICPPCAQHHSPEYFGQDPEKFDPERFIEPVLENGKPADSKMVRAFGGVSLCFASNEVLSYAACVLWRFDVMFKKNGTASIVPRKREQENVYRDCQCGMVHRCLILTVWSVISNLFKIK